MSIEHVDVVRGKSIVRMPAAQLLARAAAAVRVLVDLGAGDGRFAYRLARAHPDWLCIAVDVCCDGMRRLSWRALRKPSRGGAPNALFVRAAVASLPHSLAGIADEVTVNHPWGSLLRAIVEPDPEVLGRIVAMGRPGAALRIRVNASALAGSRMTEVRLDGLLSRLERVYCEAGVKVRFCGPVVAGGDTSWGRRLLGGRPGMVLAIDGSISEARGIPRLQGTRAPPACSPPWVGARRLTGCGQRVSSAAPLSGRSSLCCMAEPTAATTRTGAVTPLPSA